MPQFFREFNQLKGHKSSLKTAFFFLLKGTLSLFRHAGLAYEQEQLTLRVVFHIFMQPRHMTPCITRLHWIRKTKAGICAAFFHLLFSSFFKSSLTDSCCSTLCCLQDISIRPITHWRHLWTDTSLVLDQPCANPETRLSKNEFEVWVSFEVQPRHVSVDHIGRIQIVPLTSEACLVWFDLCCV